MRKYVLAIAGCFFGFSAIAQECATIENDLDRLLCYDKESGRIPSVKVEPVSSGKWTVRSDKSDFKDTIDVVMTVESEGLLNCGHGSRESATLLLRCKENTTSIYIATQCFLASGVGGYGTIEYRVDDKKSKKRDFNASTNNKSLGLWSGGQSIPMIKEMFGGNDILMRFTPYGESPESVKFKITGIDEAIKPLRDACHW